jgi:DNA-binding NarL/FixJ family response regulator
MISVFIIEDHPIVIDGIRTLIQDYGYTSFAGFATSASSALKTLEQVEADVVLIDINLPDMNGTELCKIINKKFPQLKILALTTYLQRDYVDKMMDNGAMGYLLKNAPASEILEGIVSVASGEKYLSDDVARLVSKQDSNTLFLSRREIQILSLIAEGYISKEIADKLFISVLTVETHRKNLLTKLNARNMVSLIRIATEFRYI